MCGPRQRAEGRREAKPGRDARRHHQAIATIAERFVTDAKDTPAGAPPKLAQLVSREVERGVIELSRWRRWSAEGPGCARGCVGTRH